MNVVYEWCCQWLSLQNKNSKCTSIVDFIEVRLFALILFLIYKYIKSLHRIPILKLLSLRLSKSLFYICLFFSFAYSLISQVPSPLRLTHLLRVLCSFSSSFADSSFLRILRMKFFSPWLLIPLSYFRWRGRLPSCCPASRLGWFQLLSPLCNALLINSKGDGLTELLDETKPRTGYPLLASTKEGKCWL